MTNTYNTLNPLGSFSAKDLSDNASNFDEAVNSTSPSFYDRFKRRRQTLKGMEIQVQDAIRAAGYAFIGDYDSGPLTVSLPNQIFSKGGEFWRAKASLPLPYVTAQNWTLDIAKFDPVGDAYLRQELASANGSTYVSHTQLGGITRSLSDKLAGIISPEDYASEIAAMTAIFSDPAKFYLNNKDAFTITAGTGGNVSTINEAIDAAVRMRPTHSKGLSNCEIRLKAGFVMREQVLNRDGSDLGWIKITAEDALTTIDQAFITEALSLRDDIYPAFGAIDNGVLPVIACKFQYASNLTARDGVAVLSGSKVLMMPFSGIIRTRRAFSVLYGSQAACYPLGLTQGGDGIGAGTDTGVDFSYARVRGLHVAYGSKASLGRSDFSHCDGDLGVYIIWSSIADLYQSDASYCTNGTAFLSRDGSSLNCRESCAARSKRGYHALHNGRINARSRITGPTMIWIKEGAQYCTEYGVLSSGNSQVEASELNASYCSGSAAISASDASTISFIDGVALSCTNRAIWSQNGSIISGVRSDVSGSKVGVEAMSGDVSAYGIRAVGCIEFGLLAYRSGRIEASGPDTVITGCMRAAEARDGSSVNVRGANLSGSIERAVSAIDGGDINCMEANLTGAGSRAITCRGGNVVAIGADCTGAVNWAAEVLNGGIIKLSGATIGASPINVTVNTVSANGIVFF